MAAKILTYAALLLGTPSFLFGYILNRATWKNDVLFLFGVVFWTVWLVFAAIDKYDRMRIRRRAMKAQARKEEYEERIRRIYGPDDNEFRNFI